MDMPDLTSLPAKWLPYITAAVVLAQIIGRAWYAWKNNGGWQGIKNSFLYGTNAPKQ